MSLGTLVANGPCPSWVHRANAVSWTFLAVDDGPSGESEKITRQSYRPDQWREAGERKPATLRELTHRRPTLLELNLPLTRNPSRNLDR